MMGILMKSQYFNYLSLFIFQYEIKIHKKLKRHGDKGMGYESIKFTKIFDVFDKNVKI